MAGAALWGDSRMAAVGETARQCRYEPSAAREPVVQANAPYAMSAEIPINPPSLRAPGADQYIVGARDFLVIQLENSP